MSQTVANQLVSTLEQIGVRHIFGLIGDSLNPLADAVRRSKIEWVGVRHEEGGALAAAGQAKLTGRLGVCAGTTGPGSTHLVAGLYEASRDHAPVLALRGSGRRVAQLPASRARKDWQLRQGKNQGSGAGGHRRVTHCGDSAMELTRWRLCCRSAEERRVRWIISLCLTPKLP